MIRIGERRCVYTVLVGGYEDLVEQPTAVAVSIDYLCFTDDPSLHSSSWQIRLIDRVLPADAARSSRYPKIMAHRFLSDYDASLYVDNAVRLTVPPETAFDTLFGDDAGFAAMHHSYRATVDDEFDAVIDAGYDAPWVCEEQREHYREHYPGALDSKPFVGGFLLRRHRRPDVIAAMERWWYHVLRYSRRDQLSMPIALAETGLVVSLLDLDVRDNAFFEWPVAINRNQSAGGAPPTT